MSNEIEICKSCGSEISEKFCPSCGEKRYRRLKFRDLLSDFFDDGVSLEMPIFKTIGELCIRPGKMIKAYLEGKRRPYYRPFKLYLFFLTIYLVFFYFVSNGFEDLYKVTNPSNSAIQANPDASKLELHIMDVQQLLFRWLIFLQIPVQALLTYLFFRKSKFSYTEHVSANLFILSIGMILAIIQTIFIGTYPLTILTIMTGLTIVYSAWAFKDLFQTTWFKASYKAVLIFILGAVGFMILIVLVSVPWAILTLPS